MSRNDSALWRRAPEGTVGRFSSKRRCNAVAGCWPVGSRTGAVCPATATAAGSGTAATGCTRRKEKLAAIYRFSSGPTDWRGLGSASSFYPGWVTRLNSPMSSNCRQDRWNPIRSHRRIDCSLPLKTGGSALASVVSRPAQRLHGLVQITFAPIKFA